MYQIFLCHSYSVFIFTPYLIEHIAFASDNSARHRVSALKSYAVKLILPPSLCKVYEF